MKRILIIDDDLTVLDTAKSVLETARELEVRTADSGAQALEVLAEWTPDLILLDERMPVLDGFGTLKAIQQWWPDIAVVFFAGSVSAETMQAYAYAGATGAICKPNDMTTLPAIVDPFLDELA
jgi:CheY-like chemotaxis protein